MRCLILLVVLLLYSCKEIGEVDLFIKDEYYYLDKISVGDTVCLNVLLENRSSNVLHIDTIMVSCECVKTLTDIRFLNPMEQESLKVQFVPLQAGYVSRGLSIRYNKRVKDIIIEGDVKDSL